MVSDVSLIITAEITIAAVTIIAINFLMGGLFSAFMSVKMSRGKKLLVRVLHPVQSYFVVGKLDEGFLVFKDRTKNIRRITFMSNCIDRAATVYWTTVDDEKNCMVQRMDGLAVDGHDAVKYDNLYVRALYKPNVMNEVLIKFALVLMIVCLLAIIAIGVISFKNMQNTDKILALLQPVVKAAVTGVA